MDPYQILGVSKDAPLEEIERAYRRKASKHHPDQGGDVWAFQLVEDAYQQVIAERRYQPEPPTPEARSKAQSPERTHERDEPRNPPQSSSELKCPNCESVNCFDQVEEVVRRNGPLSEYSFRLSLWITGKGRFRCSNCRHGWNLSEDCRLLTCSRCYGYSVIDRGATGVVRCAKCGARGRIPPARHLDDPDTVRTAGVLTFAAIALVVFGGIGFRLFTADGDGGYSQSDAIESTTSESPGQRDAPGVTNEQKAEENRQRANEIKARYWIARVEQQLEQARPRLSQLGWQRAEVDEIIGDARAECSLPSSSVEYAVKQALGHALRKRMIAVPPHGAVRSFHAAKRIAPLKIVTLPTGGYYFVKLADIRNPERVLQTAFVHSGRRAEFEVPLGSYELRYAYCREWYGPDRFGLSTSFSRADEAFVFTQTGNRIRGYTVELYVQVGGNLETEEIDASSF